MKNFTYLVACICLLFASCTQEKESVNDGNEKGATAATQVEKGAVPRDRIVYKVMFRQDDFSLNQLDEMYREDVLNASGDFETNLKNMWFIVLNKKLVDQGSDKQKQFYINEQLKMDSNLPNIDSFYKLLLSSSFLTETEQVAVSARFNGKNKKVIENVYAGNVLEKDAEVTKLIMAGRNYLRLASSKN